MSHYTVAVFTEDSSPDLDSILAPYNENIRVSLTGITATKTLSRTITVHSKRSTR